MPSPFPGMDPYLENPAEWPGLHHLLISKATELLQPQVRERGYYVRIEERIWLTEPERNIVPELAVHHRRPSRASEGDVAVLEPDEPIRIERRLYQIREPYLEIFDRQGNRLTTGVEIVSPSNKTEGKGRELYLQKQRQLQQAGVNLVEIDLLRSGLHILDLPNELLSPIKGWSYLVNIVRTGAGEYEFYPVGLRERLPRIGIPLKEGEVDAVLDLQLAFDRAYDTGPYPDSLDYTSDALDPLGSDDASWAHQLLIAKGFRT